MPAWRCSTTPKTFIQGQLLTGPAHDQLTIAKWCFMWRVPVPDMARYKQNNDIIFNTKWSLRLMIVPCVVTHFFKVICGRVMKYARDSDTFSVKTTLFQFIRKPCIHLNKKPGCSKSLTTIQLGGSFFICSDRLTSLRTNYIDGLLVKMHGLYRNWCSVKYLCNDKLTSRTV